MKTIGDLLTRDLSRKIEEIIQVDQADEQSVRAEISVYVATDSIREQYHHLLKAIAEAPADPHESVGVWVSGFFGSGKRSFAKNLGYALQNRTVLGSKFAELFKQQIGDSRISDLLDLINAKTPTEVILFEVAKEADIQKSNAKIIESMYRQLLNYLGYAEDFDIAELEITLEAEGKLDQFISIAERAGKQWATIEEFGKVGKNLLKARKITAPCWIVVTSQEKLDEVVAAIDSKRVELAKLQDRFCYRVDLAPFDIREVATKRVLAKKTAAEKPLKDLFKKNEGQLNAALRLERTTRRTDINENDFIHFYPYPPHYIDLCIGIMSGNRLQPGAPRHYGGSNRTIIKQAYEMLVSDRTAFAKKPIGALVTLDKVFELVEGNLSNEKRTDIHQISERFKGDPEDHGWALRTAKAICLLEFIRDLPRTEANLAAVLVDEVGKATPVSEVQAAVKRLDAAKFIRNTEEGWKLQTAQEKYWTNERSGHLGPKPRERNELSRTALQQIFDEPEFKTYRYQNRSFRIGISVDGTSIGDEGELPLTLCVSDDADELTKRIEEIRTESQQKSHENDLYWLFCLTPEIDELVSQLQASRKMVDKYNQMSAQQKISPDEATCLQDEKNSKNIVCTTADVAKEVLDYLKSEHSYGNKDTRMGKALEKRFGGTPYGWERDMLRLILATLFRAGEIEVTYQGNRYHNYQDPASRTPFTNNPAFRSSLFSPRQSVGLKTLTQAVQQLEDITGEEVDVEEGAIATAFKKVAAEELEKLCPLKATAEAHRLPVLTMLSEFQQTLTGIQSSASDDCVRILTENGKEFGETRDKVRKLRESLDGAAIVVLRQARQATDQVWQRLAAHNPSPELGTTVEKLKTLLASEQFIDSWDDIAADTKTVLGAYRTAYCDLFDRRREYYESAIGEIKNRTEWAPLEASNPGTSSSLLSPLQGRVGTEEDKESVAEGKSLGKASLTEMESDLAAVDGLRSSVLVKLQELSIGGEKKAFVRKVRVSEFFNRPIETQDDLTKALRLLEDALQKCIDEGAIVILE